MKKKDQIKLLKQNYSELYEHLQDLEEDIKHLETEREYMSAFISYHRLEDAYIYFRENAHEETDPELPFPYLTL